nr:retrovirus-related Pol polyprotein from transposon TNT 1-94 [Tanacetum cinerariifolium]
LPSAPAAGADAQALTDWAVLFYRHNEVVCLMLETMSPKLYQQFKLSSGMVIELQKCMENLRVLNSKSCEFQAFVQNYNMQSMEKAISEVHLLLIKFEKSIKRNKQPIVGASSTPQVMAIQGGRVQNYKPQGKAKEKWEGRTLEKELSCVSSRVDEKEEENWRLKCCIHFFRHVSKKGASYFITFSDDYNHYGYVYLLKHTYEVFETFKLTPPYTPQHNGVSKRRNHTLLNMVRSMMSLATLPLSFWEYALESAARILNMVPTKKVDKAPYELWYGKVLNLSYLKVRGCEAHLKCHTPDKLQQRSVKCIFVGYPKETMGYYFYYPPENKIVVERYADFLEKDFILQKESGRIVELEDEYILPFENTSEHPIKEESLALIISQ